jgi:hypothetical protein
MARWIRVVHIFSLFMLSYYLSLCSEFCVFMCLVSATISALKRCSVRLFPQLFVGGLMSYCGFCACSNKIMNISVYIMEINIRENRCGNQEWTNCRNDPLVKRNRSASADRNKTCTHAFSGWPCNICVIRHR